MVAVYPNGIKLFPFREDVSDYFMASYANQLQDEVTTIEAILGANVHRNPDGFGDDQEYANLSQRIDAINSGFGKPYACVWSAGTIVKVGNYEPEDDWGGFSTSPEFTVTESGTVSVQRAGLYLLTSSVYIEPKSWTVDPMWATSKIMKKPAMTAEETLFTKLRTFSPKGSPWDMYLGDCRLVELSVGDTVRIAVNTNDLGYTIGDLGPTGQRLKVIQALWSLTAIRLWG